MQLQIWFKPGCNHAFRFDWFLCVVCAHTKNRRAKNRGSLKNIKSTTMHVTLWTKEALEHFEWNIAVIAHSVGYRCGPYNGLQRIVWKNREKSVPSCRAVPLRAAKGTERYFSDERANQRRGCFFPLNVALLIYWYVFKLLLSSDSMRFHGDANDANATPTLFPKKETPQICGSRLNGWKENSVAVCALVGSLKEIRKGNQTGGSTRHSLEESCLQSFQTVDGFSRHFLVAPPEE